MCYLRGKLWVHQRTESPFTGAVKDAHWGKCLRAHSLAPPQTRGMWATSWWGLWGLCHFHTSRCRMTPLSPTAEHSHYSPCYDREYSSVFGKDYSCSLLGKFSVIRSFQTLNLTPEIVWSLHALFSTTAWCDPHLAESCELKLIYTTWSLNMQTIIFSLKNTKNIYLKLPVLNGSLILLKIPSSTFKPTEGKNINNLLIAPAGPEYLNVNVWICEFEGLFERASGLMFPIQTLVLRSRIGFFRTNRRANRSLKQIKKAKACWNFYTVNREWRQMILVWLWVSRLLFNFTWCLSSCCGKRGEVFGVYS